ncbi:TniQ family protein [Kitasatospora indigofera]|uniref:TniQ family protein n=1 Tax=Kitasatospora indigofera TaxID=67307 RepID=UPI00339F75EF
MTRDDLGTRQTQLPRSLDPLPEECLNGYVLRLAHRLGVSPDHIARRTGLGELKDNGQTVAMAVRSTVLPATMAADFATATRLTPAETIRLTLADWACHYPPISHVLNGLRPGRQTPQVDWLFSTTARYCPDCLAGDGSPVQDRHGGPWQRAWRLPVFFACLRHQRFLEHLCPTCRRPVAASAHGHLIGRPSIPGLHPAQCRQRHPDADKPPRTRAGLCQGRLDHAGLHPADRPGPELLALQARIAEMLTPQHPAVQAGHYFTELQLVTALVIITWPRSRPDVPGPAAAAADQHVARHHSPDSPTRSNAPPTDARACAAFLHAADTIVASDSLRAALARLAPEENRTRTGIAPVRHHTWDRAFKIYRGDCSERFQLSAETLVHSFRRTKPGGRRIPLSQVAYRPEHVPAFIPHEWADRHLGHFTGASQRLLRRTAATYLVRRARGGSLVEAARYLGIRIGPQGAIGFGGVIGRWIRAQDNLHAFEFAVDAIAAELEAAPKIDYQHRRRCLADWALPPSAWHRLVSQLQEQPGSRAITDDRKRLAVSAYLWAQATQGEYYFSPCPPHIAADPEAHEKWTRERRATMRKLQRTDQQPHYRRLKPLLDDYAAQLTKAIDTEIPHSTTHRAPETERFSWRVEQSH